MPQTSSHVNSWWRSELDDSDDIATPNAFQCPITQERFCDPVVAADGHTYERVAIERWLSGRACSSCKSTRLWLSPLTGMPVLTRELRPNYALRKAIDDLSPEYGSRKRRAGDNEPQPQAYARVVVATLSIVTCCLILGLICCAAPRVIVKPPQPACSTGSWWHDASSLGATGHALSDSSPSSLFLPLPLWYGAAPASASSQASISSYSAPSVPEPAATAPNGWHKLLPRNGKSAWPGSLLLLAGLVLCGSGLVVHDDQVALALVFAGAPLACVSFVVGLACANGGDAESALFLSRCLLLIGFLFCGTGVFLTRSADRLDRLHGAASGERELSRAEI